MSLASRLLGSCALCCGMALLALPARAAQFQFNTLVQLGEPLHNAPNGWEVGWGPNTGAPTQLGSMPTYWSNGASRQFQVIYNRPANSMEVRIYNNGSGTFANAFYTPPGGPSPVNAVWRLPASSFFVTALAGGNVASSINVSSLALTTPTGGALTILSPLSTTSLTSNTGPALPTKTVTLSNDVVFLGDATGSWRLSGFVTMNFAGLTGSNYNRLQFGLSAIADIPEPSTWAMMALGLALVGFGSRRRP